MKKLIADTGARGQNGRAAGGRERPGRRRPDSGIERPARSSSRRELNRSRGVKTTKAGVGGVVFRALAMDMKTHKIPAPEAAQVLSRPDTPNQPNLKVTYRQKMQAAAAKSSGSAGGLPSTYPLGVVELQGGRVDDLEAGAATFRADADRVEPADDHRLASAGLGTGADDAASAPGGRGDGRVVRRHRERLGAEERPPRGIGCRRRTCSSGASRSSCVPRLRHVRQEASWPPRT